MFVGSSQSSVYTVKSPEGAASCTWHSVQVSLDAASTCFQREHTSHSAHENSPELGVHSRPSHSVRPHCKTCSVDFLCAPIEQPVLISEIQSSVRN
ncbi:hypothetical protein CgunFtcFv8_021373 [Champsocephalus gunnari]|nr:hypothetical protein CgunFtcFv8_021373 [Champsocephalus gunnari]